MGECSVFSHLKSSTWSHWFRLPLSSLAIWTDRRRLSVCFGEFEGSYRQPTYICARQRRKAHGAAVLDDGPACAVKVDIDVGALVDADLSSGHDDDAVADAGDVGRAVHVAGDDEALGDVLEGQAQKAALPVAGTDMSTTQPSRVGQAPLRGGVGRRAGQDDVEARVV